MAAAQFSIDGAGRRDPMRDYFVGTTHRKDTLCGGLWDKLRDQLDGRPAIDAPLPARATPRTLTAAGLTLTEAPASLSTILAYTLGVTRWEPLNPNAEHRPCPSPGSRFTVEATLSVADPDGRATWRYLPHDHLLVRVPDQKQSGLPEDCVEISLTCDLSRCASPYGDLAYCLATIELGAIVAQLVLIAGEFELRLDPVRVVAATPRFTAHVIAPEIAGWLRETPPAHMAVLEEHYPRFQIGNFPLLRAMLSSGIPATAKPKPFANGLAAKWPGDVFGATARRSSGLQLQGGSRAKAPPHIGRLTAWLDPFATAHASFAGLERHGVRVDVLLPGSEPLERAGPWRLANGSALFIAPAVDADRAWGYFAPPNAMIVTVSVEYCRYVEEFGDEALFHLHLAAGIVSQMIGLASAATGLACRPMRSFDHAAVDATLPIDNWSVLQLVIWADEAVNPAFRTINPLWSRRA
jgi:hypothetical protein